MADAAEETAAIENRLADSARYLASDELEGRSAGSKGLELAADYIAEQFRAIGVKTELFDGKPTQPFEVAVGTEVGQNNRFVFQPPPGENGETTEAIELKSGEDFTPISVSSGGEFDLPLVFVGYGITGKKEKYDDYAGVDVKGKAVIILRHEPQQADPKSVFDGTKITAHAPLASKISNAYEHGAAGVILCTDLFEVRQNILRSHEKPAAESDPLLPFRATGGGPTRKDFPIVHCHREVLDRILTAALEIDLAKIEERIDADLEPQSRELPGWRITGQVDIVRKTAVLNNVVAVLEGEGPLADETIVIGAHYDHVGTSETGGLLSRLLTAASNEDRIYNGADDNASGTAALIEIARSLAGRPEKLRRRVVFIAFSGEERGLLGSAQYVAHPLFPLENTVAMLNLDMVGRLRDDKLTVMGSGTAKEFDPLLDKINQRHAFTLSKSPGGFGPSDQASFYGKNIPILHFITGGHSDLHRPSDEFEKLNVPGMRRVSRFVEEVAVALADAEERPQYVSIPRGQTSRGGNRPYLGTVPDFGAQDDGYAVAEVIPGGPAEKAGLRAGDVITQFGQSKIGNLEDITGALSKHKPGDRVKIVVRRSKETLTVEATLDKPR
ncbi:MAG TPA: M20/M25/M40 family metallo-hydrolase [Thermoguttaceae bacterium]|nr:M20/M25/M40 family metallo-hydrolase [Thermoguttaceae bacterium]